jgi:hypothetical protein
LCVSYAESNRKKSYAKTNIRYYAEKMHLYRFIKEASTEYGPSPVRGAGNLCWQIRISTCTVTISESVLSLLLTPVTGARRQQQALLAQCV